MRSLLIPLACLLLLACFVVPCSATELTDIDQAIAELPHDQDKLHLTLFVDGRDKELPRWFESDSVLAGIRSRTHFHIVDVRSPLYREKYAHTVRELPLVRLQTHDEYICDLTRDDYSNRPDMLGLSLTRHICSFLRRGRHASAEVIRLPEVQTPANEPAPAQVIVVGPAAKEPEKPKTQPLFAAILSTLLVLGGVTAVVRGYRAEHYA